VILCASAVHFGEKHGRFRTRGKRFVNYKCVERANEKHAANYLSVAVLLMAVWMHAAVDAGRPKIYGIAYVKVKVTDVEKSKAFYGGVLGLRAGGTLQGRGRSCFSINESQHVELVKTNVGDKGPFLPEIGLATNSLEQMAGT